LIGIFRYRRVSFRDDVGIRLGTRDRGTESKRTSNPFSTPLSTRNRFRGCSGGGGDEERSTECVGEGFGRAGGDGGDGGLGGMREKDDSVSESTSESKEVAVAEMGEEGSEREDVIDEGNVGHRLRVAMTRPYLWVR
jgi:hypothetical protein